MYLVSTKGQVRRDNVFNASGSIASGSLPQLVLPESPSRGFLLFQNLSSTVMWLEIGPARATATLTAGVVTAISVTASTASIRNPGFGYTYPPIVNFVGGGDPFNTQQKSAGQYGYPNPNQPAVATAVLTAGAVTSFTINNGGSGYVNAPYVFIQNDQLDPFGCADPSQNSGSGYQIPVGGGSIVFESTFCPTDPIAVFCTTVGAQYTCMWAP